LELVKVTQSEVYKYQGNKTSQYVMKTVS